MPQSTPVPLIARLKDARGCYMMQHKAYPSQFIMQDTSVLFAIVFPQCFVWPSESGWGIPDTYLANTKAKAGTGSNQSHQCFVSCVWKDQVVVFCFENIWASAKPKKTLLLPSFPVLLWPTSARSIFHSKTDEARQQQRFLPRAVLSAGKMDAEQVSELWSVLVQVILGHCRQLWGRTNHVPQHCCMGRGSREPQAGHQILWFSSLSLAAFRCKVCMPVLIHRIYCSVSMQC